MNKSMESTAGGWTPKAHVYYILAGNPNTPARALRRLARSPFERVRLRVAENGNTPDAVLLELLSDENIEVRLAAASNGNVHYGTLTDAIENGDESVRYMLADDQSTPTTLLFSLFFDENPYVAFRAEKTLRDKLL